MENLTHFVTFKVIWVDPHVFEVKIHASNQRFSGTIDSYINAISIQNFIDQLKGFPDGLNAESITYEEQNYSQFSLTLRITSTGIVIASVGMKGSDFYGNNNMQLELYIEPAAIDNFHNQLSNLVKTRTGEAILIGYK